jgi:hypothetical protein
MIASTPHGRARQRWAIPARPQRSQLTGVGYQDTYRVGILLFHSAHQVDAVDVRQIDVGQDEVGRPRRQGVERGPRRHGEPGICETSFAQGRLERVRLGRVADYDQ